MLRVQAAAAAEAEARAQKLAQDVARAAAAARLAADANNSLAVRTPSQHYIPPCLASIRVVQCQLYRSYVTLSTRTAQARES